MRGKRQGSPRAGKSTRSQAAPGQMEGKEGKGKGGSGPITLRELWRTRTGMEPGAFGESGSSGQTPTYLGCPLPSSSAQNFAGSPSWMDMGATMGTFLGSAVPPREAVSPAPPVPSQGPRWRSPAWCSAASVRPGVVLGQPGPFPKHPVCEAHPGGGAGGARRDWCSWPRCPGCRSQGSLPPWRCQDVLLCTPVPGCRSPALVWPSRGPHVVLARRWASAELWASPEQGEGGV